MCQLTKEFNFFSFCQNSNLTIQLTCLLDVSKLSQILLFSKQNLSFSFLNNHLFFLRKETCHVCTYTNNRKASICPAFSLPLIPLSQVITWFSNLYCYISTHQSSTSLIFLNNVLIPATVSFFLKLFQPQAYPFTSISCLLFLIPDLLL